MDNLLPFKMLMKGTLNGILTGLGAEADEITNDDFPEEGIDLLRKAYLYYYKDEQASANALAKLKAKNHPEYDQIKKAMDYNQISYAMINDLFDLEGSFFRDFESGGLAEDLKLVLGNFTVKAQTEDGVNGFRIYDKYDYPNNDKWFKGQFPEIFQDIKEAGYDTQGPISHIIMSAMAGKKNLEDTNPEGIINKAVAAFYPLAHTIGGWSANENRPDDEKLNVNVFIPFERNRAMADGSVNSVIYPEAFPEARPSNLDTASVMPVARPENLETASAVVPNGPMDEERASMFDGLLNLVFPKAEAAVIETPKKEKPLTFKQAFAQARSDGLEQFEFTNKSGETKMYTTELAK